MGLLIPDRIDASKVAILKPVSGNLRIRFPKELTYAGLGFDLWTCNRGGHKPVYNYRKRRWEVPRSWFNKLVDFMLERYKSVYVIQSYNVYERCAPSCVNALGHECECSCLGKNHGSGDLTGWYVVSDTFAIRHQSCPYSCKLLKVR